MIYTTDMGFATESGNVAPISAIDAIMDIYESALEYNETSFLYEGAADAVKNTARNLATKVVNFINGLIQKVKDLVRDKAYKKFVENYKARRDKDVYISEERPLKIKAYAGMDSQGIKALANRVLDSDNDTSVKTAKSEFMDKLKSEGTFPELSFTDAKGAKGAVDAINKATTELVKDLNELKKEAISSLKHADDPTRQSRYAAIVTWAANTLTNKVLSNCIKAINSANSRFEKKAKEKK